MIYSGVVICDIGIQARRFIFADKVIQGVGRTDIPLLAFIRGLTSLAGFRWVLAGFQWVLAGIQWVFAGCWWPFADSVAGFQ